MTKTEAIRKSVVKIRKYYNDLNDDLYDELDKICAQLDNIPPIKVNKVITQMLAVKKASDSGQALFSCQGQAMDGYSELANYRSILDNISYETQHNRTCKWIIDEDGMFDTGCGNKFEFISDGPKENHFTHCPYCGGKLAVHDGHL